jgi:Sap, sulfolipid-1-addressing protein
MGHSWSMGGLIVHILPLAALIALEPICVLAALVMTATDRPFANSVAYLGALVGVMLGYGAAVLLVFQHHAAAAGGRTDDIVQLLWLLLGLGFLAAAAVMLARRPRESGAGRSARWTRRVTEMGPLGAAAVGVFLVNWEMETPALTVILKSRVSTAAALAALVVFTAIAVSTSVVPVTAYLAAPGRVGTVLGAARDWLGRYERPIMIVLLGIIGVAFTYLGGAALLGG